MTKFTNANEARRRARKVIGKVPGVRVIPDKRGKPPKHKLKYQYQSTIDVNSIA